MDSTVCHGCGCPPFVVNGQTVPLKRCSVCRKAWYHNVECQRGHYKLHKNDCVSQVQQEQQVPYQIQEMGQAKGYGVVATKAIEKDTVLSMGIDQPYLDAMVPPVLYTERWSSHCLVCFQELSPPIQFYFQHPKYTVCICNQCQPLLQIMTNYPFAGMIHAIPG